VGRTAVKHAFRTPGRESSTNNEGGGMAKSSSSLVVGGARGGIFIAQNYNRLYLIYNFGGM